MGCYPSVSIGLNCYPSTYSGYSCNPFRSDYGSSCYSYNRPYFSRPFFTGFSSYCSPYSYRATPYCAMEGRAHVIGSILTTLAAGALLCAIL